MADPVGAAAATLTFVKVAYGCLVFIQELRSHTPESFQRLALNLEAEYYRYREWCDLVGLKEIGIGIEDNDEWLKSPQIVDRFERQLRRVLRFDSKHIAAMIIDELRNMEQEFRQAREKLEDAYASLPLENGTSYCGRRTWSRLLPWANKAKNSSLSSFSVASTGPPTPSVASNKLYSIRTSVKWELIDKKTFENLSKQITEFNNVLYKFLSPRDQSHLDRRTMDSELQNDQKGLTLGSEIHALATIKEQLKREELSNTSDSEHMFGNASTQITQETGFMTPTPVLDPEEFTPSLELECSRSFSTLGGQPVMVEWTYYSSKSLITVDQFSRKEKLVRLLNQANTSHTRLRTLRPTGIVSDRKNLRIGLVLLILAAPKLPLEERSLLDLLGSKHIPIGQRFSMAREFTTTVYRLQSVGWLHKSLRTDNLLCFGSGSCNISTDMEEDHPERLSSTAPQLYLAGWYLSRPDHQSEVSHSISISRQGYTLTKDLVRLSSHPDSFRDDSAESTSTRPRFQPEYDIYSCGLVLLQIGLWMSLPALRDRCKSDDDFRQKAKGVYCDMLRNQMGEIYWRATKRCLHNNFNRRTAKLSGMEGDGEAEEVPLYAAFERQVVSELERCVA
ncbi:hypothetical protein QBC41DRAFT_32809 [Cercophora samala]|uniref:Prion-inhibition and propagation HeLo domain-containing protein n=1 Tax=Cercophora samala TaxID=330535 RepID=A0AA39Z196_9PEZI|nr:hypothetical protein QBC41DRAFT_32809 [Cercophora samala]